MENGEFKVYENRLRRAARRQGLRLVKSRRQGSPEPLYLLVPDDRLNWQGRHTPSEREAFANGEVMTLADVERALDFPATTTVSDGPSGDTPA